MKVIVAGSRTFGSNDFIGMVGSALAISNFEVDEIVSGGAAGIDSAAIQYAKKEGIPVSIFNANWDKYGKAAGPIRNSEMAKYADALVLIYDGSSRGSVNMLDQARREGLKIFKVVVNYEDEV